MVALTSLLFAAAVYTASQGSAVEVKVPSAEGVVWQGKRVPAFRKGDGWITILGVDLDTKPGAYHAGPEITIDVAAKKFPTSKLNVDEQFVELSEADAGRAARESR